MLNYYSYLTKIKMGNPIRVAQIFYISFNVTMVGLEAKMEPYPDSAIVAAGNVAVSESPHVIHS